jgi:hypothetical protein
VPSSPEARSSSAGSAGRRARCRAIARGSDLGAAAARADELIARRASGATWLDIVSKEEPPLVIETITRVLDELGELGSRFRREEALALQRENVSITKIGELFRVSRQRVSTLLHGTRSRAEA